MRPKSLILLVLALGCGLIASIGISQVMDRAPAVTETVETTPVFVARVNIPDGEPIKAAMVQLEQWPVGKVPDGAITAIEDLEGHRVRHMVYKDFPITTAMLGGDEGASERLPDGYRAVAVKVTAESVGGNLIRPGDRVDVQVYLRPSREYGIETPTVSTFLRDIRVFAVNDQFRLKEDADNEQMVAKTVSLQVTPDQAKMVTLARRVGEIQLILRGANDPLDDKTKDLTIDQLLNRKERTDRNTESGIANLANNAQRSDLTNLIEKHSANQEPEPQETTDRSGKPFQMYIVRAGEVQKYNWTGDTNKLPDELAGDAASQQFAQPIDNNSASDNHNGGNSTTPNKPGSSPSKGESSKSELPGSSPEDETPSGHQDKE